MEVLGRIRWSNVARAAAVVAAIGIVLAWPHLRPEGPAIPPQPVLVDAPPQPATTQPEEDDELPRVPEDQPREAPAPKRKKARGGGKGRGEKARGAKARRGDEERRGGGEEEVGRSGEEAAGRVGEAAGGDAAVERAAPAPTPPPAPSQAQGEFGFE